MPPLRALSRLRTALTTPTSPYLNSHFHSPLPPPQLPPPPLFSSTISSFPLPDSISLIRLNTNTTLAETLLRWRATPRPSMTALGDSLFLFRTSPKPPSFRARKLPSTTARPIATRIASQSALVRASAGMGLAALVAQEERDASAPAGLLRLLSSTKGPQRVGIGWLSRPVRLVVASFMAGVLATMVTYVIVAFPVALPWMLLSASVCFAARPDLPSFYAWTKRCAPLVAKKKTVFLDKIRAQMAPYVMTFNPPVLDDYALFSVVTVVDAADYVYVYAGFLSRWCLLGWYNMADDYNFDKIRTR